MLVQLAVIGNAQGVVVIRDVTAIDMVGSTPKAGMTVIVEGNRIANIGRKLKVPKSAAVIDGRGKFLIPGLWDMHSHFLFEQVRDPFMKLSIANGVTGVRDLGSEQLDLLIEIRRSIAESKTVGPRIVAAGPIVDGPKPVWPFSIPVANADEGRKAVQSLKTKGADFVKVYSLLSRDSYFAIADEAKKQKIPFAGHVPNTVTTAEASDAGQKSIEHIRVYLDVSTDEQALRQERLDAEAKGQSELNRVRGAQHARLLETFNEEKVRLLAGRFAKNGTWFVPTLTVHRSFAFFHDPAFVADPRLKYMPEFLTGYWKTQRERMPEEATKRNRVFYTRDLQVVGLMHEGGAKLLAGSDTMNPFIFPGFSLHDELALLVEAGLTPLEALRTATANPAAFLDMEKDLGTIEKGKFADLVLLDANPLSDIRNTTKINAVIANGRLFDRAALDALLSEAEKWAAPGVTPQ
jgi:imidazolonepropionase-like amidohydrolase